MLTDAEVQDQTGWIVCVANNGAGVRQWVSVESYATKQDAIARAGEIARTRPTSAIGIFRLLAMRVAAVSVQTVGGE